MKTVLLTACTILYTALVVLGTVFVVSPEKLGIEKAPKKIGLYEFYQFPTVAEYKQVNGSN